MKLILCVLPLLFFVACSSTSSRPDFVRSPEYESREGLKDSVDLTEGKSLTSEEIRALLSSKVDLKRPLKIAVVKTDALSSRSRAQSQSLVANEQATAAIDGLISKSKYIKDISFIPRFLIPENASLRNLRDVAAVMQADLLLMLFARTSDDSSFKLLGPDQVKATVVLESMLVDVRTGAVPFTSVATGIALEEKDKKQDFNEAEFRSRTILKAESKAFVALAHDLVAYVQ